MSDKKLFTYKGPVTSFGKVIQENYEADTFAISPSKAKSNLIFRFKKMYNMLASAKIELPGKLIEV